MKRTVTFYLIMVLVLFCPCSITLAYWGGDGTVEKPYQINSPADWLELMATSSDWDLHFVLMADIDLSGVSVSPVGSESDPFVGSLDGNDFVMNNITTTPDVWGDQNGLFEYVGPTGKISNLGLDNIDVSGRVIGSLVDKNSGTVSFCYAISTVAGGGGLVGINSGTISDCYAISNITGGGGLVSRNSGMISNCYAISDVNGGAGLVSNNSGTISNCYAVADVTDNSDFAGGLVSLNSGTITFCSATGNVSGVDFIAGLVGYNEEGTIRSCYAMGSVIGVDGVGGLVGESLFGTIDSCYAMNDVRGEERVGGLVGTNGFSTITSCYATGNVYGGDWAGGLIGWNLDWRGEWSIGSCYATGNVSGGSQVGGLVGRLGGGKFIRCYSTGKPEGTSYVGGMCGFRDTRFVYEDTENFWDIETSGIITSVIGTGKTTNQMQAANTFLDFGWDFVGEDVNGVEDVWRLCVDGVSYPRLSWEYDRIGDFECPDGVATEDLSYLAERWLMSNNKADIDGDGVVNLCDYVVFAQHWLE